MNKHKGTGHNEACFVVMHPLGGYFIKCALEVTEGGLTIRGYKLPIEVMFITTGFIK